MNSKELQKALVTAVTEDYVKETGDQNPDSEKIQKYIEQKGGDKYLEQKLKALTKKAAHGAKLDYISKLKSPCSEGETLEIYKKGGQLCTRCIKGNFGRKLPTAPDASEAYRNGNIKRRKNFTVVTASISSAPDPRRIEQRIKGKDTTYVETPGNIGEGIRIKHRKASSTDKNKSEYNILKRRFKQAAAQATTSFKNGKKIKVSCGGTKVAEKGCKVKTHRQGGSLNGVPFISEINKYQFGGKNLPTAPKAEDRYVEGKRQSTIIKGGRYGGKDKVEIKQVVGKKPGIFGSSPIIRQMVLYSNVSPSYNDTTYLEVPERKNSLVKTKLRGVEKHPSVFKTYYSNVYPFFGEILQDLRNRTKEEYEIQDLGSNTKKEYEILKRRFNTAWNLAK